MLVLDVRNDLLVPDVAGYLLILIALRSLARREASFALARWPAVVAAVAWIGARFTRAPWPSFAQAFFEIVLIWLLCTGVMRLAEGSLFRAAGNARGLTILAGVLNFAYAALLYGFHVSVPYAGMVLLAFGWSVMAIVMRVMWRARSELSPELSPLCPRARRGPG
jgi:hypothetical protein